MKAKKSAKQGRIKARKLARKATQRKQSSKKNTSQKAKRDKTSNKMAVTKKIPSKRMTKAITKKIQVKTTQATRKAVTKKIPSKKIMKATTKKIQVKTTQAPRKQDTKTRVEPTSNTTISLDKSQGAHRVEPKSITCTSGDKSTLIQSINQVSQSTTPAIFSAMMYPSLQPTIVEPNQTNDALNMPDIFLPGMPPMHDMMNMMGVNQPLVNQLPPFHHEEMAMMTPLPEDKTSRIVRSIQTNLRSDDHMYFGKVMNLARKLPQSKYREALIDSIWHETKNCSRKTFARRFGF